MCNTLPDDGDTFRLLRLLPRHGPIRAELQVARISAQPDFEALSYVWGPPIDLQAIVLEGDACMIRPSLAAFLQMLRLPDRPRLVFADALCIQQDDDAEKSFQVQMMGDIYAAARSVLAWLGPGMPETDALFQLHVSEDDYSPADNTWQPILPPDVFAAHRAALHDVVNWDYWKRAWIVQECLLARGIVLYAGHAHMDWERFRVAHMFLFGKRPEPTSYTWAHLNDAISRFDHVAGARARRAEFPQPLPSILRDFCVAEATDPRDMLFAFSRLMRDMQPGSPGRLRVNYEMAATELYFRAAYAYVASGDVTQPHRVLPILRRVLRVDSQTLYGVLSSLVDPLALASETQWLVGHVEGVLVRTERRDMPYIECHRVDFTTIFAQLEK